MKILVTGGAGYIGSILVRQLLNNYNAEIVVVDNLMYGQTPFLDLYNHADFTFVKGDVRDKVLMKELVKDADFIIPLAAIVGMPACNKDEKLSREINFESIKWLADDTSPSQYILYPTTNSGYGAKTGDSFCTEETPLEPISRYGIDKAEAEDTLLARGNATTFRLATVFGLSPRMRLDLLVNDFVYKAYTESSIVLFESHFKRNFVHVRDVVDAFIMTINGTVPEGVFNLGCDQANMSKLELCNKIKGHVPNLFIAESQNNKDPDKRNYIVSSAKLMETGWYAARDLDYGIEELLRGYPTIAATNNKYTNL